MNTQNDTAMNDKVSTRNILREFSLVYPIPVLSYIRILESFISIREDLQVDRLHLLIAGMRRQLLLFMKIKVI